MTKLGLDVEEDACLDQMFPVLRSVGADFKIYVSFADLERVYDRMD